MFVNAQYTARSLPIGPDGRLVIFSDGVTGAQNAAGEEFGDDRLIECCRNIPAGIDAKTVAEKVMHAVGKWSAGTEPFDDTTVFVMDIAAPKR
jgi:sigma-B regulation protein RsbU (phosphoserine phosphatase)